MKNSTIKKDFKAKGLKNVEEILKIANIEDEERREYQRFGEVFSYRDTELEMAKKSDFTLWMKPLITYFEMWSSFI